MSRTYQRPARGVEVLESLWGNSEIPAVVDMAPAVATFSSHARHSVEGYGQELTYKTFNPTYDMPTRWGGKRWSRA